MGTKILEKIVMWMSWAHLWHILLQMISKSVIYGIEPP